MDQQLQLAAIAQKPNSMNRWATSWIATVNLRIQRPAQKPSTAINTSSQPARRTVALPSAILHLDTLFFATPTSATLQRLKYPDFPSFKGRMDLIKMPYLRNYQTEQAIYESKSPKVVSPSGRPSRDLCRRPLGGLTRLIRPNYEGVPESIRNTLRDMSPLEKAEFYAEQAEPEGLSPEQVKELRAWRPMMLERQAE